MKGFIFDLDGTVYLGESTIPGAAKAIQTLRDRGDRVLFLTNKPISTRQSYVEKLTNMGIKTSLDEVLSSSQIMALYLASIINEGEEVLVIGEQPMRDELTEHGISIVADRYDVPYVVLSWDRQFHYDDLNLMYQAVVRGAKVLVSNPDQTCPVEGGQIPDTGALMAALEAATGKPIDIVVGKPSLIAAEIAMQRLNLKAEDCYMVGDRLETDIKMGNDAGMNSVLVLTGIASHDAVKLSINKPKYIIDSIVDIHTV